MTGNSEPWVGTRPAESDYHRASGARSETDAARHETHTNAREIAMFMTRFSPLQFLHYHMPQPVHVQVDVVHKCMCDPLP